MGYRIVLGERFGDSMHPEQRDGQQAGAVIMVWDIPVGLTRLHSCRGEVNLGASKGCCV